MVSWLYKCVICNSHIQLIGKNHVKQHIESNKHKKHKKQLEEELKEIQFKLKNVFIQ